MEKYKPSQTGSRKCPGLKRQHDCQNLRKVMSALSLIGIILNGCSKMSLDEPKQSHSGKSGIASMSSASGDEFTIAVIGDTQNYVDYGNDPDDADCQAMSPFTDMINWVKNNKTTENIKYVVTLGDITDQFGQTNTGTEGQWQRARATYDILLNNNIPFGVVPGNHDMKLASTYNYPNNGTSLPVNPFFDQYFPRSIFPSYNQGGYPVSTSNENHYDVVNTPAGDFLFIYLRWYHVESEAGPAVNWAYNIASAPSNADKKIVLVTHYTVARTDADLDGKNDWGMQKYQNPGYSESLKVYNKLKSLPNFFMFLGGHATGEFERQDTYNGNTVKSFTTDFSNSCGTGSTSYPEGVIRTMKFSLSKDLIEFKSFVPGQAPIKQFSRPWYHSFTTSRTADFNNDGKSQPSFFDNGVWKMYGQSDVSYGSLSTDIPVPGDYDADGKTDIAIFRQGGTYNSWLRPGKSSVTFGQPGDIPAPGDYDGNGTTDFAFFRPSTGTWYVKHNYLPSPHYVTQGYGVAGDIPVPADYDGDGKVDYALFRPSTAEWFRYSIHRGQYGHPGDIPVPGDYNGDGIAERSVYRPSNHGWYIYGTANPVTIGQAGDIPVPGDYDGDGTTDIAVYRPSNGNVYIHGQTTISTGNTNAAPLNLPYAIQKFFFP